MGKNHELNSQIFNGEKATQEGKLPDRLEKEFQDALRNAETEDVFLEYINGATLNFEEDSIVRNKNYKTMLFSEALSVWNTDQKEEITLKTLLQNAKTKYEDNMEDMLQVAQFTEGALAQIPERLKHHNLEVRQLHVGYQADYDIGIEIYEARIKIADAPNLSHHEVGDTSATPSAIAQALEFDLTPFEEKKEETRQEPTVAFIKPNKDSIGAAAVISLRMQEIDFDAELVEAINLSDRYGSLAYEFNNDIEKFRNKIVLMDSIAGARNIDNNAKVALFKAILTGEYPEENIALAVSRREEYYKKAEDSAEVHILQEEQLAFVKSNDRFAPEIGYNNKCPIVISQNDKFPTRRSKRVVIDGENWNIPYEHETVNKYSISLYDEHVAFDMEALKDRLNMLEKEKSIELGEDPEKRGTWGGRSTIIGSPEGENTLLSPEEIQTAVMQVLQETEERLEEEKSAELIIPHMYEYATLDLRDREKSKALLEAMVALGVEVTDEEFASLCKLGNIDTQHGYGIYPDGSEMELDPKKAAVQKAFEYPIPEEGAGLVTVNEDADAIATMAAINIALAYGRAANEPIDTGEWIIEYEAGEDAIVVDPNKLVQNVEKIAKADQHGRGEWQKAERLPQKGDVPPLQEFSGVPAGLHRLIRNRRIPLEERVLIMEQWLLTSRCRGLAEANKIVQEEYEQSIKESKIQGVYYVDAETKLHNDVTHEVELANEYFEGATISTAEIDPNDPEYLPPAIAYVHTSHRGGLALGYNVAPITIAMTDTFQYRSGEVGRKYTIAQHEEGYFDMEGFLEEIRELDPGAGGSPVIVGSGQAGPCNIEPEQYIAIAVKYVKYKPEPARKKVAIAA